MDRQPQEGSLPLLARLRGRARHWLAAVALLGQIILGAQLFICDLDEDCPDPTGYCPACVFAFRAGPPPVAAPVALPAMVVAEIAYQPTVVRIPASRDVDLGYQPRAPPQPLTA